MPWLSNLHLIEMAVALCHRRRLGALSIEKSSLPRLTAACRHFLEENSNTANAYLIVHQILRFLLNMKRHH